MSATLDECWTRGVKVRGDAFADYLAGVAQRMTAVEVGSDIGPGDGPPTPCDDHAGIVLARLVVHGVLAHAANSKPRLVRLTANE